MPRGELRPGVVAEFNDPRDHVAGLARVRQEVAAMTKAKPNGRAPRQPNLPGTDDRAIRDIEKAAHSYADLRRRRQALHREELVLKDMLLKMMKTHNKTSYHRKGIAIAVVTETETVTVQVRRTAADAPVEEATV